MMDRQTARLEYRTLRPPRGETKKEAEDPESILNENAEAGWELVETIDYSGGGTKFLVLARPVRSDDGDPVDRDGAHDHTEEQV